MANLTANVSIAQITVGEIVATRPGATAVLRRHGIDTCYGTEVSLAEAAVLRGIDLGGIEEELTGLERPSIEAPAPKEPKALIGHIQARYHAEHRRELPELVSLARRVEAAHENHPNVPRGLADVLHQMQVDLEAHMRTEETILFPALVRGGAEIAAEPIAGSISQIRKDHEDQADALARIDAITDGLSLPERTCPGWQALYLGTRKLARDLGEHMRLENEVLFPRIEAPGQQA